MKTRESTKKRLEATVILLLTIAMMTECFLLFGISSISVSKGRIMRKTTLLPPSHATTPHIVRNFVSDEVSLKDISRQHFDAENNVSAPRNKHPFSNYDALPCDVLTLNLPCFQLGGDNQV